MSQSKQAGEPSMPEPQVARTATLNSLIIDGCKLVGAFCVLLFLVGDPSTRLWMLGFLGGTISGLTSAPTHAAPSQQETLAQEAPALRLLDHNCRQEYGYQTCEGEVRNISGERLDNVMAEIRFQDKAGIFIKSQDAMIEYQPLMPGQTSSFKVVTSSNPLIKHYTVSFKQMFEGALKVAR